MNNTIILLKIEINGVTHQLRKLPPDTTNVCENCSLKERCNHYYVDARVMPLCFAFGEIEELETNQKYNFKLK